MRLIQLFHQKHGRRVAKVQNSELIFISPDYSSCYTLFEEIIRKESTPQTFIPEVLTDQTLDYEEVYSNKTPWKILPAFDHPGSPLYCMLSGTGLTHKASADNRQQMHKNAEKEALTDSMQIYLWGEEEGKPEPGSSKHGVQPEWFYKGNGINLKAFSEPLEVPSYGNDGGEEPEVAGIYMISEKSLPYRIGFATANEFSDHVMEKKNYLYLAPSKLRTCSIGPELVIDNDFKDIKGRVAVSRNGTEIWSKEIRTGEQNMCHSLDNIEYHHFKYAQHRIPGTVHIHFYGADAFSFGEGISLEDGDQMSIRFEGFGKPLINPIRIKKEKEYPVTVKTF